LYILAGGKSRRFGSDKARAVIDGRPLLVSVLEALQPVTCCAHAVAATQGAYDDLGITTLADDQPGAGPLAGLQTALIHASSRHQPWVLLASCDLVRPDVQSILQLGQVIEPGHRASLWATEGWFEPFPGLYHVGLLPAVEAALQSGDRSMQAILRGLGPAVAVSHMKDHAVTIRDADTSQALRELDAQPRPS
jgi:molybdopterin-guanine dinucleotide biosynthesis protein A